MSTGVFVIAEAGVNHNGSLDLARELVDVAAEAGADAVKFQTFSAERLVDRHAPKAAYQVRRTGGGESQLEMLRRLELSESDHEVLIAHARARSIAFLSTPFDLPSLRLLTERFGVETIKVPSGEITNGPFLLAIAGVARRVILSTGMSTLAEVEAALEVLAFGFQGAAGVAPGRRAFAASYATDAGRAALRERVSLLHCTSEYPAPAGDVNLRAMDTLAHAFGLPVGYSDHTAGFHIALAAVARGARVLEKHFTLDRTLPGPDHEASLEPLELRAMVGAVREIERALGDGVKRPMPSELDTRSVARRRLVASRAIQAGETLGEENVTCMRPGVGMSPMAFWEVAGRVAARSYAAGEALDE